MQCPLWRKEREAIKIRKCVGAICNAAMQCPMWKKEEQREAKKMFRCWDESPVLLCGHAMLNVPCEKRWRKKIKDNVEKVYLLDMFVDF